MKRFQVLVAAPADAEIQEAYLFIHRDSPGNAVNWRLGLLEAVESLRAFPERCPLAPENGFLELELRQFIYGNYRMIFTVQGDAVIVLHVRHGARAPMKSNDIVPPEFQ